LSCRFVALKQGEDALATIKQGEDALATLKQGFRALATLKQGFRALATLKQGFRALATLLLFWDGSQNFCELGLRVDLAVGLMPWKDLVNKEFMHPGNSRGFGAALDMR